MSIPLQTNIIFRLHFKKYLFRLHFLYSKFRFPFHFKKYLFRPPSYIPPFKPPLTSSFKTTHSVNRPSTILSNPNSNVTSNCQLIEERQMHESSQRGAVNFAFGKVPVRLNFPFLLRRRRPRTSRRRPRRRTATC